MRGRDEREGREGGTRGRDEREGREGGREGGERGVREKGMKERGGGGRRPGLLSLVALYLESRCGLSSYGQLLRWTRLRRLLKEKT